MINNNKKTTILITSIMLTAILLLPSSAFGELPPGCAAGSANISGLLQIDPAGKTAITVPMDIANSVANTIGEGIACDAEIENSELRVNGAIITPTADCPYNQANYPVSFTDGQTVDIHPGLMGACSNVDNLLTGLNQVEFDADGIQFNIIGADIPAPWSVSVSTSKPIFDRCILVEKDGPEKVKLDDFGEAVVTYSVTVTNCGEGPIISDLDNCSAFDAVAGGAVNPGIGTISPGFPAMFEYDATIFGDTENTVEVTCLDQNGDDISDSDTHFVETYTAGITVVKEAPPKLEPLDTVFYDIWIFNDGSSTISDCIVDDPSIGFFDDTSCQSIEADGSCHIENIPGGICAEAIDNQAFVTCLDQELEEVSGQSEIIDAPFCAAFSVDIDKMCDTKVVQVPDNPANPIHCEIWVENDGPGTLTDCVVGDSLSGPLANIGTLLPGEEAHYVTDTDVTLEMIAAGTVTNTATIECDTQEDFPAVSDEVSVDIEVRSVDGDVVKNCETTVVLEPGTIEWDWTVSNDSPDGTSSLDVSCDGFSTINDPEAQDALDTVLAFGGTASNMWTESGLASNTYDNEITCTFTAQNDQSFEKMASDSCDVDPVGDEGCTPGFWRNNLAKNLPNGAWAVDHHESFVDVFGQDPELKSSFREATHKGGQGKGNVLAGENLAFAIWAQGGGDNALARHAVAALLNSASPDVAYSLSTMAIIDLVDNALASGDPSEVNAAKSILAGFNEDGCSINNDGTPKTDE